MNYVNTYTQLIKPYHLIPNKKILVSLELTEIDTMQVDMCHTDVYDT